MMGIIRDHKTPYPNKKTCHECGEPIKRGQAKIELKIFDDPWGTKPSTVRVHTGNDDGNGDCLDKLTNTSWASFRYQECPRCERMIVSQHLDNGWRSFFKPYGDEEICVACYQEIRLADGEPAETFEAEYVGGDFYNSSDISGNNWSLVPGYLGLFLNSKQSAQRFCETALGLIRDGHKVLVDWGAQAYGGGEGYYSLYVKANMAAS